MKTNGKTVRLLMLAGMVAAVTPASAEPMGTAFSYQGQLKQGGVPVNGPHIFLVTLWNDASSTDSGAVVGAVMVTASATNGLFTMELDFGPDAFNGEARWLEFELCDTGACNVITPLSPRQEVTATPYAQSAGTANAVPWNGITGVPAGFADGVDNVGGAGDGHSLDAADGTPVDALVVDNVGNVGIGTPIPTAKLDVRGSVRVRDNSGVEVQDSSGNARTRMSLGELYTFGPNGSVNFKATANGLAPNTGAMLISDDNGDQRAGMYIHHATNKGIVWGDAVGIGTTVPDSTLHVKSAGAAIHVEDDSGSATAQVYLGEGGDSGIKMIYSSVDNELRFIPRVLGVDKPVALSINRSSGNVGIGTAGPRVELEINPTSGNADLQLRAAGEDTGWNLGALNFDGSFRLAQHDGSAFTDRITVSNDGNVGIGTTNPGAHRLSVRSSAGGSTGTTVFVKNTNTTNGIAMKLDNASTDVTLLVSNTSTVDNGDLIRADSWVGGWHPVFKVSGEGRVTCNVLEIQGGSDLSEQFDISASKGVPDPGTVVCIDADNPGQLAVCGKAHDRTVAGIISGAGGVKPGMLMGQRGSVADGEYPVALTGRVYVRADTSSGPIVPGDLLTTSPTPGHAMKVTDYQKAQGAIIGKAMTALESGQGLVLVLVSLQ